MKILILTYKVPKSFTDKQPWHFFQELKPLTQLGHQLTVVSDTLPNFQLENVSFLKLPAPNFRMNPRNVLSAITYAIRYLNILPRGSARNIHKLLKVCHYNRSLTELIRKLHPDIIHSHWAVPCGSAGYIAATENKIPLVMTLRGFEHVKSKEFGYGNCLDPYYEETLRKALDKSSAITICCSDSESRLTELGVSDFAKVRRIFHAVDSRRFESPSLNDADSLKESLKITGKTIITCIALLSDERKGHAVLLDSFAELASRDPSLHLVLVGGGQLKTPLMNRTVELNIQNSVTFTDSVHPNDVARYIGISTLTILPTHLEVFGNVVFESLLMGIPVISGKVGTAKDVLPIGPFGVTYESSSIPECKNAIRCVLDNHAKYSDYAEKGKIFVKQEMSIEKRANAFAELYSELLLQRKSQ